MGCRTRWWWWWRWRNFSAIQGKEICPLCSLKNSYYIIIPTKWWNFYYSPSIVLLENGAIIGLVNGLPVVFRPSFHYTPCPSLLPASIVCRRHKSPMRCSCRSMGITATTSGELLSSSFCDYIYYAEPGLLIQQQSVASTLPSNEMVVQFNFSSLRGAI